MNLHAPHHQVLLAIQYHLARQVHHPLLHLLCIHPICALQAHHHSQHHQVFQVHPVFHNYLLVRVHLPPFQLKVQVLLQVLALAPVNHHHHHLYTVLRLPPVAQQAAFHPPHPHQFHLHHPFQQAVVTVN